MTSDPNLRSCAGGGAGVSIAPMKRRLSLLAMICLPSLAFGQAAKEQSPPATPVTPAAAEAKASQVRLKTSMGDVVLELDAAKAPLTVANFLGYVGKSHYDGTVFHRVMKDFMIQGGGFAVADKALVEKSVGKGILNEGQNGLKNLRGTVAMARTNDPNSATAQFFINVVDNPMLDYPSNGGYAVFGKVIEGMEVVDLIRAVPTGVAKLTMRHPATGEKIEVPSENVPTRNVVIVSASVVK